MKQVRILSLLGVFAVTASAQITTANMETVKPEDLGALLAGPGIQISNVKISGSPKAIGTFNGAMQAGLGMERGVILSSGDISTIVGPNVNSGMGTPLSTPGDPDLDQLVSPLKTEDATILEFDFITESPSFSIRYVFGSEEYKEFVDSAYNDVFGFFVNGVNIAFVGGSQSQLVTVNSINHLRNTGFYIDNPTLFGVYNTELDGFTTTLIATATVTPGTTHHIKLAIADTSDPVLDSVVLLQAGGISGRPFTELIPSSYETYMESEGTLRLDAYGLETGVKYTLSQEGLPEGTVVTFNPSVLEKGKVTSTEVSIEFPGLTFPTAYEVTFKATPDKPGVAVGEGKALIRLGCIPPMILALDQPASQTVVAGNRATLTVKSAGTGPFFYQWYEGPRGSTHFPIAGATSSTFMTPVIQHSRSYWVRVENRCGTVDSATARITTSSSRSSRPVRGTRR